ncbi:MAG: hypothetical protein JO061_24975, partial [Acidobacteriaceae bacterium]|nr:hypothetical protein [Acidobacteriaceae bacterium]
MSRLYLCLLFLCSSVLGASEFRVLGPGGGGAMFNPTLSPHDPNTVLVSCDMTGNYITHDAGRSWRMFNLHGTTQFFVFDPNDPKVIYLQATGLWRSRDAGASWEMIYPKRSAIRGVRMSSDHADETIVADPNPLGVLSALAIDPANSGILYAGTGENTPPALFMSRDGGETWIRKADLSEHPKKIWVASGSVYMSGVHSVAVWSGSSVKTLRTPEEFIDMAGSPPNLYGIARDKIFVSQDGGATWVSRQLPGAGATLQAVASSLHHASVAYVSYEGLALDGQKWMGVAKTSDCGQSWTLVWKETQTPAPNIHDAWITPTFGTDWGGVPLMLGVADQDGAICYATDLGRTMRTLDGGRTWTAVYSRKTDAGWTSTGLDVTTSYGVHFDPFNLKRQFITYTDIGLFRSEDGGSSWMSSTAGVPREWRNTTYWMVFDPEVRGRVWSVNSNTHDLPRPKMWRHRSVLTYRGGVCGSDDGGRTWRPSNRGMDETAATHIVLDPSSPVNARVLYVAGFGRGVYKSVDGGRTWALKNRGIMQREPLAWRIVRSPKGDLYLLVARRSENGSIGNSGDGAIYRSS